MEDWRGPCSFWRMWGTSPPVWCVLHNTQYQLQQSYINVLQLFLSYTVYREDLARVPAAASFVSTRITPIQHLSSMTPIDILDRCARRVNVCRL